MAPKQKSVDEGNPGARANKRGREEEATVVGKLEFYDYTKQKNPVPDPLHSSEKLFWTQPRLSGLLHAYTLPHADVPRVGDVLFTNRRHPSGFVVECKYQEASGSKDESPFILVAGINLGRFPTGLLLAGDGWRKAAIDWLIHQAGKGNLRHVWLRKKGFQLAIDDGFLDDTEDEALPALYMPPGYWATREAARKVTREKARQQREVRKLAKEQEAEERAANGHE